MHDGRCLLVFAVVAARIQSNYRAQVLESKCFVEKKCEDEVTAALKLMANAKAVK